MQKVGLSHGDQKGRIGGNVQTHGVRLRGELRKRLQSALFAMLSEKRLGHLGFSRTLPCPIGVGGGFIDAPHGDRFADDIFDIAQILADIRKILAEMAGAIGQKSGVISDFVLCVKGKNIFVVES